MGGPALAWRNGGEGRRGGAADARTVAELQRDLADLERRLIGAIRADPVLRSALEAAARELGWEEGGEGNGGGSGGGGGGGGDGGDGGGPPPASEAAIRRLPTVTVEAGDLLDEANRQCPVCLADTVLGQRMVRLPCGHLFHGACVGPWLRRRCTCPACRHELPTDCAAYEVGRLRRRREEEEAAAAAAGGGEAGGRAIRLRRHDLERMAAPDLRELARVALGGRGPVDRRDLIDSIARSGRVDVVAAPDPVRRRLADLRAMGVAELREDMNSCGVYYDPARVVEKEDMVQLFMSSGRVVLVGDGDADADAHGSDVDADVDEGEEEANS